MWDQAFADSVQWSGDPVVAEPDVCELDAEDTDEFVVLATDGLWCALWCSAGCIRLGVCSDAWAPVLDPCAHCMSRECLCQRSMLDQGPLPRSVAPVPSLAQCTT